VLSPALDDHLRLVQVYVNGDLRTLGDLLTKITSWFASPAPNFIRPLRQATVLGVRTGAAYLKIVYEPS
jgi:hypothetical protein